jgi:hypothetical protein
MTIYHDTWFACLVNKYGDPLRDAWILSLSITPQFIQLKLPSVKLSKLCDSPERFLYWKKHTIIENWKITSLLVKGGNIPTIEWAINNRLINVKSPYLCDVSACYRQRHILEWARFVKGCQWGSTTSREAAVVHDWETVKWLYEQKCPWSYWTSFYAANDGNLTMLKWLHERKCPLDKQIMVRAAQNNHESILRYLHSINCPRHSDVMAHVVRSGSIDTLMWLHDEGYPMQISSFRCAIHRGDLQRFILLHSWGLVVSKHIYTLAKSSSDAYDIVAYLDTLEIANTINANITDNYYDDEDEDEDEDEDDEPHFYSEMADPDTDDDNDD